MAGCVASVRELDFSLYDIRILPAAIILIVMGPISLIYGTLGLLILSRASNVALSFTHAFRVNCAAQLAEFLPLPGGAIVRTGALVAAGGALGKSAALVTLGALLWISIAALIAGSALYGLTDDRWLLAFCFASLALLLALLAQLFRLTDKATAIRLLMHRIAGCTLVATRLALSFAAIGLPLPVLTAFVFSLANIAGSAAAIAPAGLGVSELFGAAIATGIDVDPYAAFLAIALNRALGLVSTGAIFAAIESRSFASRNR